MSPDQTRNVSLTAALNAFIPDLRLLIQFQGILEPNVSPVDRGRDGH